MEKEEAIAYCRKLKRKLDQNSYDEVFNTMRYFKVGLICPGCVASKVESIFDGRNDLMESFMRYLPENISSTDHADGCRNVVCKNMKQFHEGHSLRRFLPDKQPHTVRGDGTSPPLVVENGAKKSAVEFFNRVQKSVNGDNVCKKFLDAMIKYTRHKDLEGLDRAVSSLFKASPELYVEFTSFMADTIAKQSNHKLSRSTKNGLQKIVMSRLKQNMMNRFEDDMYEQDMLLGPLESTIEKLEEIRQACEKNPDQEIEVGKQLNVIYLGCIKRHCNDESGENMVDRLRQNPGDASRVILSRLRPRVEELKRRFNPLNKQRANAIKKLHGRSCDPD